MDDLDEIVQEFVVESHENLDQLDRDLVALEQTPDSRDLLSSIFRTIHTIKGTSGFLAFGRLEAITHVGENLLSRLRDGAQRMTPETTDALLAMVDTVRALLLTIEQTGAEGDVPVDDAVARVTACIRDDTPAESATAPAAEPTPVAVTEPAPVPEPQPIAEPIAEAEPEPVAESAPDPEVVAELPGRRSAVDTTIRVDVELLDSLMRLVGELVLTRNQIVRSAADQVDPGLVGATQRLNLVTTELQESVMKTRMQPIDGLWAKFPRIIRDLAAQCGKQITLAMQGKETELDRTLLEAVKDPLTHLVRNAVDHGVENPDDRIAAGKPPNGTLTLRAYHQGGHVVVEVADDGGGIDPETIGRIAIKRGLVTSGQLGRMRREEILDLLSQPGFSTAASVTNVSGRGVGMDVVRTNIEKIGGTVDLESTVGSGTTWRLTIPLTLAIVAALTVECGGERYAIPQIAVQELVCVDSSGPGVEYVAEAPVYRLRGRLLPLVSLAQALGVPSQATAETVFLVVQADGRRFGLVVDRVLNTEEIVVKPLSSRIKAAGVYAGATILGDGRVALILDIQALARASRLAADTATQLDTTPAEHHAGPDASRLLVATAGSHRIAIPLESVTRLEDFALSDVERVGQREVVQYRGEIMPLLRVGRLLGSDGPEAAESLPAIVYSERGRSVGLVVDRVVDILDGGAGARTDVDDAGLLGSAVIQKQVTELLDVRRAILAADPNFYDMAEKPGDLPEKPGDFAEGQLKATAEEVRT